MNNKYDKNSYLAGFAAGMKYSMGGQRKLQTGGQEESIEDVYNRVTQSLQMMQNGDTSVDQEQIIQDLNTLASQNQNQEYKQWATQILQQINESSGSTMRRGGVWGKPRMQSGGQGNDPMAELQQIAQTLQQIGQALQNGQLDEQMMQTLEQIGQILQQYAQSGDQQVAQLAQQIMQELFQPIVQAIQQAQQQAQAQQQPQGQPMKKGGNVKHNFFSR